MWVEVVECYGLNELFYLFFVIGLVDSLSLRWRGSRSFGWVLVFTCSNSFLNFLFSCHRFGIGLINFGWDITLEISGDTLLFRSRMRYQVNPALDLVCLSVCVDCVVQAVWDEMRILFVFWWVCL